MWIKRRNKILIVEDDEAVLDILKIMLGDKYELAVAHNGREAIEAYKSFKPDVVLMDIVMPEMDGIQATKEILKIDPNAKILAVTAYTTHKGKAILEAGARETIEKPFTRKKLLETIEKHIQS